MTDWTQDPAVVTARERFEARKAEWLAVAPGGDCLLPANPTPGQQAAHDRMQLADSAYEVARDGAFAKPLDLSTEPPLSEAEQHVLRLTR